MVIIVIIIIMIIITIIRISLVRIKTKNQIKYNKWIIIIDNAVIPLN